MTTTPEAATGFRLERDSLGDLAVPDTAYWGVHSQRALQNFPVSGIPVGHHRHLVRALGFVKQAAATANGELGLICPGTVEAIVAACERIRAGEVDAEFCVDVIQGGAGTSTNMNANEVIANLALEHLVLDRGRYDVIHPIDHVNRCQSTNDVYPKAIKLALVLALGDLRVRLRLLADAFAERGRAFAAVPKIGRTQLQDSVPMTLGQEFTAFSVTIDEDCERLAETIRLIGL